MPDGSDNSTTTDAFDQARALAGDAASAGSDALSRAAAALERSGGSGGSGGETANVPVTIDLTDPDLDQAKILDDIREAYSTGNVDGLVRFAASTGNRLHPDSAREYFTATETHSAEEVFLARLTGKDIQNNATKDGGILGFLKSGGSIRDYVSENYPFLLNADGEIGGLIEMVISAVESFLGQFGFGASKDADAEGDTQPEGDTAEQTDAPEEPDTNVQTGGQDDSTSTLSVRGPASPDTSQTEFNRISMQMPEDAARQFIAAHASPSEYLSKGVFDIFELSDAEFAERRRGYVAALSQVDHVAEEYATLDRADFVSRMGRDYADRYDAEAVPDALLEEAGQQLRENGIEDADGSIAKGLAATAHFSVEAVQDATYENGVLSYTLDNSALQS